MNWKIALAVAGLCAVVVYSAHSIGVREGKRAVQQEMTLAELEGYKVAANSLLEASVRANASLIQVGARHNEFTENYKNLVDFDCYADSERMQHIFDIYRAPTLGR